MINKVLEIISKQIEENKNVPNLITDGETFEKYVYDLFQQSQQLTELNIKSVTHNGKHSFPDLKVILHDESVYGIEIKFSASGNWYSKGNSVFETHSNKEQNTEDGYKEIYLLFGRKPKAKENINHYQVKYAPYGNCIDKIEVTHSPRFSINMNIGANNLFNTLGFQNGYAEFRAKDNSLKNDFLRNYFNTLTNTNEADKWYVDKGANNQDNEINEAIKIQPIPFNTLNTTKRRTIVSEAFILFPNDLLKNRAYYSNVVSYIISKHFVFSPALRDEFSSGGKAFISTNPSTHYPKMLITFYEHQNTIKELLRNPHSDFEEQCFTTWETTFGNKMINRNLSLEYNYENILHNLHPIMEIKQYINQKTFNKFKQAINLSDFYHLDFIKANN
jgi:hypothetical protein